MFASCSMSGMDFAFPDVCLTPIVVPVPIPYPNTAQRPMAIPPTANMKHLISMMPAHTLSTMIPISMGDNAGVNGGVMSGIIMGPSRNLMGSMKVFSGGMPQTKWLSPAMQNLTNCPAGMTLVPSQFKLLILS